MTTALFMLRCAETGIAIGDLEYLSIGSVLDIFTEKANDDYNYSTMATQEDMDRL